MATEKHKQVAEFIKDTHKQLRIDSQKHGANAAWEKHCSDKDRLKKYAEAMQALGSFWEINSKDVSKEATSRNKWIREQCEKYFFKGDLQYQRAREEEIANKISLSLDLNVPLLQLENNKIKLLDVGSCYNPLREIDIFDCIGIDLSPANSDVFICDFLKLTVSNNPVILDKNAKVIKELQTNSFDTVLFSLLLEYLPSSDQRLLCCKKAYELLKLEGILIVITPDSKHVGANAKLMKSWRNAFAHNGFMRIKYEKLPHLHCLVFRKCIYADVAKRWTVLHQTEDLSTDICIPQDFQEITFEVKKSVVEESPDNNALLFDALPTCF